MQKRARAAADADEAEKEVDEQTWSSLQAEGHSPAHPPSERDETLKKLQAYVFLSSASDADADLVIREYEELLALINKGLKNITDDEFVPSPPHWHAQNRAPPGHGAPLSELDHLLRWLPPATVSDVYLSAINDIMKVRRDDMGRTRRRRRDPVERDEFYQFFLHYFLNILIAKDRFKKNRDEPLALLRSLNRTTRFEEISAACAWTAEHAR